MAGENVRKEEIVVGLSRAFAEFFAAVAAHYGRQGEPQPPANNDKSAGVTFAEPKIGDEMKDGTIYAGVSPDSGKPMYTTPADAPGTYTFDEAAKYAKNLDDGYFPADWRVPSKSELNVLFNNRAAIGGFNETGSDPAGWYWSSSRDDGDLAWAQRFSDGYQDGNFRDVDSSLRCVR